MFAPAQAGLLIPAIFNTVAGVAWMTSTWSKV